ncbi:MAG: hypothetical protein LUD48_01450 [Prevotella sp.]|nr:hypothetical protein [Prevotella sp.]
MTYYTRPNNEIYHHGIKGQAWGVRNGPPYPLYKTNGRNAAERKENGSGSGGSSSSTSKKNKKLSGSLSEDDKAKLLGIGAAAAASIGIAAWQSQSGKREVNKVIKKNQENATGEPLKKLSGGKESLDQTLKNTNPLKGNQNCVLCSTAAYLRQQGYDVTAGLSQGQDAKYFLSKCFDGASVKGETLYSKVDRQNSDPQHVKDTIKSTFGNNASGVITVQVKYGSGHAFNWTTKNGKTSFFDAQGSYNDDYLTKNWSRLFDSKQTMSYYNLDGLSVNADNVRALVERKK